MTRLRWAPWSTRPARAAACPRYRPRPAPAARSPALAPSSSSSSLLGGGCIGRHGFEHHGALAGDALAHAGAVLHVAGELSARRIDVVAPRLAHSGDDTSITQDFRVCVLLVVGCSCLLCLW